MTQTTEQPVIVGESGIELPGNTIEVEATEKKAENQLDIFNYFPTTIYSIKKPDYLDKVRQVSSEALTKRRKEQPKLDPIYPVYQKVYCILYKLNFYICYQIQSVQFHYSS